MSCLVLGLILLEFDYLIVVYVHGLMDDEVKLRAASFHEMPEFVVGEGEAVVEPTLGEAASGAVVVEVAAAVVVALVGKQGEVLVDGSSLDGGTGEVAEDQAALSGADDGVVAAHVDDLRVDRVIEPVALVAVGNNGDVAVNTAYIDQDGALVVEVHAVTAEDSSGVALVGDNNPDDELGEADAVAADRAALSGADGEAVAVRADDRQVAHGWEPAAWVAADNSGDVVACTAYIDRDGALVAGVHVATVADSLGAASADDNSLDDEADEVVEDLAALFGVGGGEVEGRVDDQRAAHGWAPPALVAAGNNAGSAEGNPFVRYYI